MQLYYITDRKSFPGDENNRRLLLLDKISEAARAGVDYIQLREKDLSGRELESLAWEALDRINSAQSDTKLLINSRPDIALAVGAHGVHLRSKDISPEDIREIYRQCGAGALARENEDMPPPIIGVSCHSISEVAQAAASATTFVVFGPVFEKSDSPETHPLGLEGLRKACQQKIPVFALGGVTLQNAESCIDAGAAGIAGIRLFQGCEVSKIIAKLKN